MPAALLMVHTTNKSADSHNPATKPTLEVLRFWESWSSHNPQICQFKQTTCKPTSGFLRLWESCTDDLWNPQKPPPKFRLFTQLANPTPRFLAVSSVWHSPRGCCPPALSDDCGVISTIPHGCGTRLSLPREGELQFPACRAVPLGMLGVEVPTLLRGLGLLELVQPSVSIFANSHLFFHHCPPKIYVSTSPLAHTCPKPASWPEFLNLGNSKSPCLSNVAFETHIQVLDRSCPQGGGACGGSHWGGGEDSFCVPGGIPLLPQNGLGQSIGASLGRKERREGGRKEGRKEGREEGRKEGRKGEKRGRMKGRQREEERGRKRKKEARKGREGKEGRKEKRGRMKGRKETENGQKNKGDRRKGRKEGRRREGGGRKEKIGRIKRREWGRKREEGKEERKKGDRENRGRNEGREKEGKREERRQRREERRKENRGWKRKKERRKKKGDKGKGGRDRERKEKRKEKYKGGREGGKEEAGGGRKETENGGRKEGRMEGRTRRRKGGRDGGRKKEGNIKEGGRKERRMVEEGREEGRRQREWRKERRREEERKERQIEKEGLYIGGNSSPQNRSSKQAFNPSWRPGLAEAPPHLLKLPHGHKLHDVTDGPALLRLQHPAVPVQLPHVGEAGCPHDGIAGLGHVAHHPVGQDKQHTVLLQEEGRGRYLKVTRGTWDKTPSGHLVQPTALAGDPTPFLTDVRKPVSF
ncbi:Splicing regulatory glutamine/lysine-rich protein 1, partial [Ophiophagus hannah]